VLLGGVWEDDIMGYWPLELNRIGTEGGTSFKHVNRCRDKGKVSFAAL